MKTSTALPHAVALKTGDWFDLAGTRNLVLSTGADTNGAMFTFLCHVPPGGGPPPHVHTREDEGFVTVEGEIELWVAGHRRVLRPGEFAYAPRDQPHRFYNAGSREVKLMIFVYPASSDRFFREACVPVKDRSTPVHPPTPEHIQHMIRVGCEQGIEFLPPA